MIGPEKAMLESAGESKAASECLSEAPRVEGESSKVLGTTTQRLRPSASFAFLHLLPIFSFYAFSSQTRKPTNKTKIQEPKKMKPFRNKSKSKKTQISKKRLC
jgi:hypothetical protein